MALRMATGVGRGKVCTHTVYTPTLGVKLTQLLPHGGSLQHRAALFAVKTGALQISTHAVAQAPLAVLFNPTRNEAYVTHRQAGKVSVIDAKSYKVVKTFDTPTFPNSLALSADGKTLYVSVKQKSTREQEATQPDDVIRIAL